MNRRGFLTILGAAGLAPALPSMGGANAARGISVSVYARAVGHVKTRNQVSAKGLAHCLKISAEQAEAVMLKLKAKGLIQPVAGSAHAISKAGDPNMWGLQGRTARVVTPSSPQEASSNHDVEITRTPKDIAQPTPEEPDDASEQVVQDTTPPSDIKRHYVLKILAILAVTGVVLGIWIG